MEMIACKINQEKSSTYMNKIGTFYQDISKLLAKATIEGNLELIKYNLDQTF